MAFMMLGGGMAAAADEARLKAYGEHLARECTTCHKLDGTNEKGIPNIVGWPKDIFIENMRLFKQGIRNHEVMVTVAKSLDDEQMEALASYFADVKPASPAKPKEVKGEKKKGN